MKKLVYKRRQNKFFIAIAFLIAVIFTIISLAIAEISYAQDNNIEVINQRPDCVAYVSYDGLSLSKFKNDDSIYIDRDDKISFPKISCNGKYVAYTKEKNLYVYDIDMPDTEKVAENISGYDWDNDGNLIYGVKNAGLSKYDASDNKDTKILDNDYNYYSIKCDSKNKIYASKSKEYTEDDDTRTEFLGIIAYDSYSEKENIIVESKKANNLYAAKGNSVSDVLKTLGTRPEVAKVSNDNRYLYIWNKPAAASASGDINGFAVYDTIYNKLIENDNIALLAYNDNISQNPVNSNVVAVNNGENRYMYYNKTLGLYNIANKTFTSLIPSWQVSMNIDYSSDAQNILYSGSNVLDPNDINSLEKWNKQPHNIYEVNVNTQQIKQITNNGAFNFMPKYLSDNSIIYISRNGDFYYLLRIKDGTETTITSSLKLSDNVYYGYYDTSEVMDVFRN